MRGHIPQDDGAALVAGGQHAAIRTEGYTGYRRRMTGERYTDRRATRDVPESDGAVSASRSQRLAVGAEDDAGDCLRMASQEDVEVRAVSHRTEQAGARCERGLVPDSLNAKK